MCELYLRIIFFNNPIYRAPIMGAYNLGKFKTKEEYLESKK